MIIPGETVIFFQAVLVLNSAAAAMIISRPWLRRAEEKKRKRIRAWINNLCDENTLQLKEPSRWDWKLLLDEYINIKQSIILTGEVSSIISDLLEKWGRVNLLLKWILRGNLYQRSYAAAVLGHINSIKAKNALVVSLLKEKRISVKRYIVNSIVEQGDPAAIPSVIDTFKGLSEKHRKSFWSLLTGFRGELLEFFPILKDRKEKEIQLFLIYYAARYPSAVFKNYILTLTESEDREIATAALKTAANNYFNDFDIYNFIYHSDPEIRGIAAGAIGANPDNKGVTALIDLLADREIKKNAAAALSEAAAAVPGYYSVIIQRLFYESDPEISEGLIDVISGRLEYIFEKLLSNKREDMKLIVKKLVYSGKTSGIINFLNRNRDVMIEDQILEVIKEMENPEIKKVFELYLDEKLLLKIGLKRIAGVEKPRVADEKIKVPILYIFLFFVLLIVPCTYAVSVYLRNGYQNITYHLLEYLKVYAGFFAYYAVILNTIYVSILVFSFAGVFKQARYYDIKKTAYLFKENILPSVSVIAPAYNEESTIIESINSLLNMRYPDYEVIVVNDGSKDNTLQKVIKYFELSRCDIYFKQKLKTKDIRAVYRGHKHPELVLIDKNNGGKADSLNCGLNASNREYFVGIDSDSLLERDSILRITGSFLDYDIDVAAAGGNIFPVNGCTVDRGIIRKIRPGRKHLVRFQTVEYIRSFMAGRIGWAYINSLLIISGAFGVFNRKRVVDAHGYMTESEMFDKDTVGEDMELVVRINRLGREDKDPALVNYVFNANCWTEIPETWGIFRKQRDRWQRGLIDILTYHFTMMFNPKYGRAGMIAFPYFFFFEMLGPWFELQGFATFIIALAAGLLDPGNVLFFFTATVFYSIFVTLCSIYLSDVKTEYFNLKDKILLTLYALMENFGFRQAANWFRVRGYISSLRKVSGWGKMERKGFTSS